MRHRFPVRISALLALFIFFSSLAAIPASAADPTGPTVTAQGGASISQVPDIIRMRVVLTGEGKNIREALAQLNQRTSDVQKALTALSSPPSSAKSESPQLSGALDPQQQMLQMMMGARRQKPSPGALPFKVTASFVGIWALKGDTPADRLTAAVEIENQIKAIDFTTKQDISPAAAEDQDERQGIADTQATAAKPGEPQFEFVKVLSQQDRDKLTTEAFEKARNQAATLARVAGREMGDLVRLSATGVLPEATSGTTNPYTEMLMAQYGVGKAGKKDVTELVGAQPAQVSGQMEITAVFLMK